MKNLKVALTNSQGCTKDNYLYYITIKGEGATAFYDSLPASIANLENLNCPDVNEEDLYEDHISFPAGNGKEATRKWLKLKLKQAVA